MTDVMTMRSLSSRMSRGEGPRCLMQANDELVRLLAERALAEGLQPTGEGGLLAQLTKRLVHSGFESTFETHLPGSSCCATCYSEHVSIL